GLGCWRNRFGVGRLGRLGPTVRGLDLGGRGVRPGRRGGVVGLIRDGGPPVFQLGGAPSTWLSPVGVLGRSLPVASLRGQATAIPGSWGTSCFLALITVAATMNAASSSMAPQKNATW